LFSAQTAFWGPRKIRDFVGRGAATERASFSALAGNERVKFAATRKKVMTINSFMSWIGGKKALRDEILMRFPAIYHRYVEVFGGGGWVLFHKPPGEHDVYNDFNPNLANLFRCVRDKPDELIAELEFTLNSRLDFKHVRNELKSKAETLPDVKRAAYFYQLIRQSYASSLDSFGGAPRSMWDSFPLIRACCGRLQRVVVENRDFEQLIRQYDRPNTFFYCDPPYFATENYYEDVGFTEKDHKRLANALLGIQGKFLLSYNDCPEIRALYDKPGIVTEGTERLSNIAQRYEGGAMFAELLIANYDTTEKARQFLQLTLWDVNPQSMMDERKVNQDG
jgi:DNA adenine methylase